MAETIDVARVQIPVVFDMARLEQQAKGELKQRVTNAARATGREAGQGMGQELAQGVAPGARAAGVEIERTTKKAAGLGERIRGIGTAARLFIMGTLVFALYQARRAFQALTGDARSFDQAMTRSLAIMGRLSTAMERQLGQTARRVSRQFNIDANLIAEGYFFLASAGLDAAQSLAALPQVTAFAKAGAFDMARATDLLTDAQSALGLTVDDTAQNMENMARVSDVLVKANTMANATVEQFAESLTNRAAAGLRLVNKDIEEGVAVLAAMADQGTKGAEAGTRLDIVLRDLQRSALKNREQFARFNVEVFDSNGNMRNLADIIADLERAMDGLNDSQRRSMITMLGFNERSVSALLQMIGLSDQIRNYERGLREAAGTTQTVANNQMRSFDERLGKIGQQFAEARRRAAEMIVLPIAEFFGNIAQSLLGVESPLERVIGLLQQGGMAADLMAPLLLRQEIDEAKRAIQEAEREVQRLRLSAAAGGRMDRTATAGGFGAFQARRASELTLGQLRERERIAAAEMDRAAAEGDIARAEAARRAVTEIQQLIRAEEGLAEARDRLVAAQEGMEEVTERAGQRRQLQDIDREIEATRALMEAQGESAGLHQRIVRLQERRAELAEKLAPPGPEAEGRPEVELDPEEEARIKKILEDRAKLLEELGERMFRLTADATELALRELDQFAEAIADTFDTVPADVLAKLEELRENILRSGVLDAFREQLSDLRAVEQNEDAARAMEGVLAAMRAERDLLPETLALRREYDAAIKDAERSLARLNERLEQNAKREREAAAQAQARAQQERIRALRDQARAIEENARAALQFGEALGVVDTEAARTLETLVQMGTALARLWGGDISALPSVIGSAASIITSVFSTAESPEDKARREVMEENTRALERLSTGVARLGAALSGTPGSDIAGILAAIEAAMEAARRAVAQNPDLLVFTGPSMGTLNAELTKLGLTMDDIERLAASFGITLDGSLESWEAFIEALQQFSFEQLFNTFAGQLSLLQMEFQLFNIDDPIAQLERILALFHEFGDLDLDGDLTTEEGREALRKSIEDAFRAAVSGELDPAVLGGMSLDEFLRMLLDMGRLIDDIEAGGGVVGGPETRLGVNITTEQGGVMISIMTTQLWHLSRIHAILAGGPVGPPTAGESPIERGGDVYYMIDVGGIIVPITIGGSGVPSRDDLRRGGEDAGVAMADAFSERLGQIHRGRGGLGRPKVVTRPER